MNSALMMAVLPATLITVIAIATTQGRQTSPAGPPSIGPTADGLRPPRDDVGRDMNRDMNRDDGPPGDRGGDRGSDRGGPPRDGFGGPGRDGPGGPPGRRPPLPSAEVMRNYLELVTRYAEISKDPSSAGVAAAITAADLLRVKGPDAAIAYFQKLLPEVPLPSVQRAIHLQLAELHKAAGHNEAALDELRLIMTDPMMQRATSTTQP